MGKDMIFNLQDSENNKIGIIGGTFDPIHYGHLFIAQTALDEFNLSKILFIPTGNPPHKRQNIITEAKKRLHMINLSIEDNPKFELSIIEIEKESLSYTIDTIKELEQYYEKGTQFYFIMGSDAFIYIESWKEYKELLKMVKFIVMTRQISKNGLLDDKIKLLINEYNAQIVKVEIPTLEISSTNIRTRIKEGRTIKYFLPKDVEKYIIDNRLYID